MVHSIVEAIQKHAKQTPEKICLIDPDGSVSFQTYMKMIGTFAQAFSKLGVSNKDRVVLQASQSRQFLAALHAVHLLSAIAVPLERDVKGERLAAIAQQTAAVLVVAALPCDVCKTVSYETLMQEEQCLQPSVYPTPDTVSTILFTTGTTGQSKGVVVTHLCDCATGENVLYGTGMHQNTREVLPMPLNHVFALRRYYANMLAGSSVVLLNGVVFSNQFFACFSSLGANAAALSPAALSILFRLTGDRFADYRDQIEFIEIGTAHLPQEDKSRIKKLLPRARLYDFYGSSEAGCSCILNFNSPQDQPFCIGKEAKNAQIAFVDETGSLFEATKSHPGRLITRGSLIMNGYYQEPALTEKTIINGWVYSSDFGYRDENGLIFLLGRMDDVIISGGNKISPFEVEGLCRSFPGVCDCALVGKRHDLMGEIPVLFVVKDAKFDTNALLNFLRQRLESFHVPKQIFYLSEIPRTYNGKILKRVLREMAENTESADII